jgi:sulfur-oxidizing protein SoxZ
MSVKPRIKLPDAIKVGDVIEVKTLVSHVMETGQRKDKDGKAIPRNIINAFSAVHAGKTVFEAKLQPGTSSNPFISFFMKVTGPGDLVFTWVDDAGVKITETVPVKIG